MKSYLFSLTGYLYSQLNFKSALLVLLLCSSLSVLAESEEEAFLKTQALTDEQHKVSQEYLHMGLHDKKVKEICGENGENDYCNGNAQAWESGTTMATFEKMIPVASSMYSMMTISGANKIGYETVGTDNQTVHKEVADYCGMVPTGVDMAAKATASGMLEHTNNQAENQSTGFRQVDALHATAKTHEENQKMSKVQAWGYGIAAGCYAATMAYGTAGKSETFKLNKDDKKILGTRLAATSLLAVFYKMKADVHGAHIEAINEEIAKFPKKGDCNPYTQTLCFCRESTSKEMDPENYMKVCLPKDYGEKARMFAPLSCVDQHNRPDPSCECNRTNSCINRLFMNDLQNFPGNSTAMKSMAQQLGPLSTGTYDVATMEAATNKSLAIARKVFNENIDDIPGYETSRPPTEAELARFQDLKNYGIPAKLAKGIAQTNPSSGLSRFRSNHPSKPKLSKKIKEKTKDFQHVYGGGKKGFSFNKPKSSRSSNPFANLMKNKRSTSSQGGVKMMKFANKAIQGAQIRSDLSNSSSIFDVISYRYKKSAWEVLPLKEAEEDILDEN